MKRRDYLRTFAVGAAASVAGCQDAPGTAAGGSSGGNSADSDGANQGTDTPEERAENHVKEAVSALNKVGFKLSETEQSLEEDPASVEFDVERTLEVVSLARTELDAASETATAEQQKDIETLRHLATVMESMAHIVSTFQGENPNAHLEEIQSTVEAENYEKALTMVRDAKSQVAAADEHVTAANEAAEAIDPARLEAVDAVEFGRVEPALTKLTALVNGFLKLATGYEEILLGREHLVAAKDHLEAREYDEANAAISDAKARFTAADEQFSGIPDDAPDDVSAHLDRSRCQTDHLIAAADHFEKATEAADDGNLLEADEQKQAGEAELQKVNEC
ncbi:hypothetical protein [Haloarchaeobius sp. TZWWS8]|uniref:hypothetical protein n=1 Tax=Haloarchaeobius sp. TZWWS8 TaxID=3446121 RepID=UPI003EB96BC4